MLELNLCYFIVVFFCVANVINSTQYESENTTILYKERCYKANYSISDTYTNHTIQGFTIEAKDMCAGSVFLLIFVHSTVHNSHRRDVIRQTWGSLNNINGDRIKLMFIIGKATSTNEQKQIYKESDKYGDLVQADFVEKYRFLTYKNLYAFKWIISHCAHAEYVFKADDDALINIYQVRELIKSSLLKQHHFYYCLPNANPIPDRTEGSKWYISYQEWPEQKLPLYCQGYGYLMSTDVIEATYHCTMWRPYIALDDAFLTGIIRDVLKFRILKPLAAFDIRGKLDKSLPVSSVNMYIALLNHDRTLQHHLFHDTWSKIMVANAYNTV